MNVPAFLFQFYISTIIIRAPVRHTPRRGSISILHKYDYHPLGVEGAWFNSEISILHKYDYHGILPSSGQSIHRFQFYISTIIIATR